MKQYELFFLIFCLLSDVIFAQNIRIVGNTEQSITLTQPHPNLKLNAQNSSSDTQIIKLLNVELSENMQHLMHQRVDQALQHSLHNANHVMETYASPVVQKQLGMNSVPVLNQGQFGTCVTFAITAAMDALIDQGDYISQLCSLQLGNYLEKKKKQPSGWDGTSAPVVLKQLNTYGWFNQVNQKKYGCGGLKRYPYWSTPTTSISPELYSQHSETLKSNGISWRTLLKQHQVASNTMDVNQLVNDVKEALNTGHRVTFAVLLPRADLGTAGAVGWHDYFNDTWMLTADIAEDIQSHKTLPGHEMVITGYDNNAVSMDARGHRHHGLFTLRNSWGAYVADWGDFYMTYDYFKTLVIDAQQIEVLK